MIINLFRQRQEGFEGLLTPHIDHLYRLAYRFSGNQHDAEDLVQELLLKLYPRYRQLREIEQLRPWLARSLYNLFIDHTRRQGRSPTAEADDAALAQIPTNDDSPEEALNSAWRQRRLEQALAELNPDQRALIGLHDMEGYTLTELEQVLETPLGTLKSRLHRARAHLRKVMEPSTGDERYTGQRREQ